MILLASGARTTSGTANIAPAFSNMLGSSYGAAFQLTVSAAATDVGDTLDVYIQSSVDGGTSWDDFVHFTQVLGNGGAKKFLAFWTSAMAPETEQAAPADATLAAGVKQGPVGSLLRIKWVLVDAGTQNASFTFRVDGNPNRRGS